MSDVNYIERWEQALRVLEAMDEHERTKHFDMSVWGKQTECGTVACLAGHCSLDPWFRVRGFRGEFRPDPFFPETQALVFPERSPAQFFGERGYDTIFTGSLRTHEEIVDATRDHLEYLKAGGDPNHINYDDEDYYDSDGDTWDVNDDCDEGPWV